MIIDHALLRLFWSVVDEIQRSELLILSDSALISLLLQQLSKKAFLNPEDSHILGEFIGSKLTLIRDMADVRS